MIKNTALSLKELYLITLCLQCSITETKNNFRKIKKSLGLPKNSSQSGDASPKKVCKHLTKVFNIFIFNIKIKITTSQTLNYF